ncbi:hypothetical protein D3C84_208480 [compost metagenome]
MTDEQVVHAAGIGGARHTQLASRVGTQRVGHQSAALDERLGVGGQTVAVETGAAHAARQVRALVEAQPVREQLLTQCILEEGRLAVQVAAGNRRQQVAEQPGGQLGGEQHRHLAGRHRPCTEATDRALGGAPTDRLATGQLAADATDVVPVVALHLPLALGDHHAAQAVPAGGVAADEAVAVAVHPAAQVGIEGGAVGLGHPRVRGEGRRLAGQRLLDGLFRRDRPRMIEIQIRQLAGHQRRIGKACAVILGGMPGDGQRRRHGLADRLRALRRGARRALALAEIEGDAEAAVAVELHRLHLALAHAGGQPLLQRHRHLAGRRTLLARLGKNRLDLFLQSRQGLRPHAFHG